MSHIIEKNQAKSRCVPKTLAPKIVFGDIEKIPEYLKQQKRWVNWIYEPAHCSEDGMAPKKEWSKVPKCFPKKKNAACNKPQTWVSYDEAVKYAKKYPGGVGLGYMIGAGEVGTDLDHCIQDGELSADSARIIKAFDSYAEVSPSGEGVRILSFGQKNTARCKNGPFEIYDQPANQPYPRRFLTITGNHIGGTPTTIERRQAAIDAFCNEFINKPERAKVDIAADPIPAPVSPEGFAPTLEDVLSVCKDPDKFRLLWAGDWQKAGFKDQSQSEADLYFCGQLFRYVSQDPNVVDEWMRRSGLYRSKWDRRDYRERTLDRAADTEAFDWSNHFKKAASQSWLDRYSEVLSTDFSSSWGSVPEASAPPSNTVRPKLLRWSEFKKLALSQTEQWIVKDIVEAGSLTIFSGLPFSGKTTVLAQMMACISQQRDFLGYEVMKRCPIVYVNADKLRERIIYQRIARTLRDELDEQALEDTLIMLDVAESPRTITAEYVEMLADESQKILADLHSDTAIVILDTLRSAFLLEEEGGAENDPTTMARILNPIRGICNAKKIAAIIPHHNNRGTNSYAGAASILGCSEGYWNLSRKYNSLTSHLEIVTRDGVRPPLTLQETPTGIERDVPKTAEEKLAEERKELVAWIDQFPTMAPEAISYDQIVERGWADNVMEARRLVADASEAGIHPRLEVTGTGKKGDPKRFFRV